MGSNRQLHAVDGFTFSVYEAIPDKKPKGGLVVIQEIFGVNSHIREVADGFAETGYVAIAPQIFDRAQRDVELSYEPDDMARGINIAFQQLDASLILLDLQAAVEEAGKYGPVGVVGYCFGGLLAWRAACKLHGIGCTVAYYGGGIAKELDCSPRCPLTMHFGEKDSMIPTTDIDAIQATVTDAEIFTYDAGHGFNCHHRASYDEESSKQALERSLACFATNLK